MKVASKKPIPIVACRAIVKGLLMTGPMQRTTVMQSAVTYMPWHTNWTRRHIINSQKDWMKGMMQLVSPVSAMVIPRNTIF